VAGAQGRRRTCGGGGERAGTVDTRGRLGVPSMDISAAGDDGDEVTGQRLHGRIAGGIVHHRWLVHAGFEHIASFFRLCIYAKWRCKDSELAITLCGGPPIQMLLE
jgi:hypothetical protein